MSVLKTIFTVTAITCLSGAAFAGGDAAAGKTKAASCNGCHSGPAAPSLNGQAADKLAKDMHDFKSGARDNATMKAMCAGLSDADIDDIAAHYAAQK